MRRQNLNAECSVRCSYFYCRVIKAVKNARGTQSASNLKLAEGEFILDVDGTVPTQPVLQHIGISAWPGESSIYGGSCLYFSEVYFVKRGNFNVASQI